MARDIFEVVGDAELNEAVVGLLLGYTICCIISVASWATLDAPVALVVTLAFFGLFRLQLVFFSLNSNRILNNRISIIWAVSVLGQMVERSSTDEEFLSLPDAMAASDNAFSPGGKRPRSASMLTECAIDVALMFASAVAGLALSPILLSWVTFFVGAVESFFGRW